MLYEGMPLKQAWLVEYLQRLNYQKTEDAIPETPNLQSKKRNCIS